MRKTNIKLGKIGYLNILPIYYPLEYNLIKHDFCIKSGPPARLNRMMQEGELEISAASSIEYARRPEQYYLLPNLAIGSRGPVQSVLLLSRYPLKSLAGKQILVSAQTHTSAALLRVLLSEHLKVKVDFESGDITRILEQGGLPDAFLAIGDEALLLRNHPEYPFSWDLGQAWLKWTGLPFIFGVWVVQKWAVEENQKRMTEAIYKLLAAKDWGMSHLQFFAELVAKQGILDVSSMYSYFSGLVYDLDKREQAGLYRFYDLLASVQEIDKVPDLRFFPA